MNSLSRRHLLKSASAGMAAGALLPLQGAIGQQNGQQQDDAAQPSQPKLKLAVIGVSNRGAANLDGVAGQDIVALCDVDQGYLQSTAQRFPDAKLYQDYRVLFEEVKELDGVVISTPDHHHAPAYFGANTMQHLYFFIPY